MVCEGKNRGREVVGEMGLVGEEGPERNRRLEG